MSVHQPGLGIHRALKLAGCLAFLAVGCVSGDGWQVTDARTCSPQSAPRLCVVAEPDQAVTVKLDGFELLPGECGDGPADAVSGTARIRIVDSKGQVRSRGVALSRGWTTTVRFSSKKWVRVEQHGCTDTP